MELGRAAYVWKKVNFLLTLEQRVNSRYSKSAGEGEAWFHRSCNIRLGRFDLVMFGMWIHCG